MDRRDALKTVAKVLASTGVAALTASVSSAEPKNDLLGAGGYIFDYETPRYKVYRRKVVRTKPVTILDESFVPFKTIGPHYVTETVVIDSNDGKIVTWPDVVSPDQRIYCRNLETNEVKWFEKKSNMKFRIRS